MELAFDGKSLRAICENEDRARRELGERVAEVLKHRLADMDAAISVTDLIAGNPHAVSGTDGSSMAVELCDGYCVVFTANHVKNPTTESGTFDWARVGRIKLLRIEGHNE